jgi:ribosomal protein S12 methylthiotransferase
MATPRSVYLNTVNPGCGLNAVECGQILHYLQANGHRIVGNESEADFIIFSTCAFITWFENSSETAIQHFLSSKRDVKLVVVGCLTRINRELIAKYQNAIIVDDLKGLDEFFYVKERFQEKNVFYRGVEYAYLHSGLRATDRHRFMGIYIKIARLLSSFLKRMNLSPCPFDKIAERDSAEKEKFFVKIGEGCVGNCTYCNIKNAKRTLHSRKIEDIISDIKNNIDLRKEKSLVLVHDDCGSYGLDIQTDIIQLLYLIGNLFPSLGIELYYFNPRWIERFGQRILGVFEKVKINNIDIPIQSGSPKILNLMNRKANVDKILGFVNRLRKISPETMIYSHVILGFPGERFKDFLQTIVLFPFFDTVYPFAYSNIKGTKSYGLPEQVPDLVIQRRVTIAIALVYLNFIRILLVNIIHRKKKTESANKKIKR